MPSQSQQRALSALAARQKTLLTTAQLHHGGASSRSIERWRAAGRLHQLHRGVHTVSHPAQLPPGARELAAALACGKGAVVSHRSAAATVWGLCRPVPGEVHVTIAGRLRAQRDGIRLHFVPSLDPRDVRKRDGIPVTSPARSILDMASSTGIRELERIVKEAYVRKLASTKELEAAIARAPHRQGAHSLKALLAAHTDPTMSNPGGEELLHDLIRRAGLPEPRRNAPIGAYNVDFLWPEHQLVAEADSWTFHGNPLSFETDHRRDVYLRGRGLLPVRYTWHQLNEEPLAVVADLATTLERLRQP